MRYKLRYSAWHSSYKFCDIDSSDNNFHVHLYILNLCERVCVHMCMCTGMYVNMSVYACMQKC